MADGRDNSIDYRLLDVDLIPSHYTSFVLFLACLAFDDDSTINGRLELFNIGSEKLRAIAALVVRLSCHPRQG